MATTTAKRKASQQAHLVSLLACLAASPSQPPEVSPVRRRQPLNEFVIEQAVAAVRGAQARRDSVARKLGSGSELVSPGQLALLEQEVRAAVQRLSVLAPGHPLTHQLMKTGSDA